MSDPATLFPFTGAPAARSPTTCRRPGRGQDLVHVPDGAGPLTGQPWPESAEVTLTFRRPRPAAAL
jgi:hypothetical protein